MAQATRLHLHSINVSRTTRSFRSRGGQRAGNFDELVISLPSSHFASPPPSPATLDSVSDDVDDDEPAVPHSPGVSQSRKSRKYRRGDKGSPDLLQAADTEEATSADGAEGSGAGPSQPMHADAEQHGRPRRLRQKYANVQAQLNVKAETEARVALEKKLKPFGGRCWWCWEEGFPHDPDAKHCCDAKEYPLMSAANALTRLAAKGYTKPHGRKQTALSPTKYSSAGPGAVTEHGGSEADVSKLCLGGNPEVKFRETQFHEISNYRFKFHEIEIR